MFNSRYMLRYSPLLGRSIRRQLFSNNVDEKSTSRSLPWSSLSWQRLVGTSGGVISLGFIIKWIVDKYSSKKEIGEDTSDSVKDVGTTVITEAPSTLSILFSDGLAKTEVKSSSAGAKYASRPNFENQIKSILTDPEPVVYNVVYGPKGAGKTELVSHSAIDQKAVLNIAVKSDASVKDLISSVIHQLTGTKASPSIGINEFKNLIDKFIAEKKIIPTIIFDVEMGSDITPGTYKALRLFSKTLIRKCRCIIIISEASAVVEFTGDNHRERFFFIDELKRNEADTLLDNCGATFFTEDNRKYIYDNVGTNPAMLVAMIRDVNTKMMTVESCVDLILRQADRDLNICQLQPILAALKKQPEGVSIDYFKGTTYNGVNLNNEIEVGAIMKNKASRNPLIYRMELMQYQLMSTAHKTALMSYNPPNPDPVDTRKSL